MAMWLDGPGSRTGPALSLASSVALFVRCKRKPIENNLSPGGCAIKTMDDCIRSPHMVRVHRDGQVFGDMSVPSGHARWSFKPMSASAAAGGASLRPGPS
jgi:hypothetical protein